MKYLIIKCKELNDQYECDADRTPVCVTDDYSSYNKKGYEIYRIEENGNLTKIREYDEVSECYIGYFEWNDEDDDYDNGPLKKVRLKNGDRDDVSLSDIKKWKKLFHFSASANEIKEDIDCCGAFGALIGDKWCVLGVAYDDDCPTGV